MLYKLDKCKIFIEVLTAGIDMTCLFDLYRHFFYLFRIYQGPVPTLVISDPKTIKEVMVKDFSNCPNRRVSMKGYFLVNYSAFENTI